MQGGIKDGNKTPAAYFNLLDKKFANDRVFINTLWLYSLFGKVYYSIRVNICYGCLLLVYKELLFEEY